MTFRIDPERPQCDGPQSAYFELLGQRFVYVTLSCGGIKQEGNRHSVYHSSLELSQDAFQKALDDFLRDKPGMIFWRRRPEWQKTTAIIEGEPVELFIMTARLIVVPN